MSEGGFPIPEKFQEVVLNYSALVDLEDERWWYVHNLLKQGRRWEALAMANIELPPTTIIGQIRTFYWTDRVVDIYSRYGMPLK